MEIMKEDSTLPVVMGKLEIEPVTKIVTEREDNPFSSTNWKSSSYSKSLEKPWKCICERHRKKDVTIPIYKKKTKIIKEPTLKFQKICRCVPMTELVGNCVQLKPRRSLIITEPLNEHSLCALVDCKLKIPADNNIAKISKKITDVKESGERNWTSSSCSQEVLNPPCDVTIDELASYFETLVHIPKKMSSMAEMMYI